MIDVNPLLGGLLIFAMRVTDVSLGTVRILNTMRGRKWLAGLIGFVEVTIFMVAISQVLTNLGNLWNLLGYSGGFAAGTILGVMIEERLALGFANVRIISPHNGKDLVRAIREAGYGATEMPGEGLRQTVSVIEVVVRRRQVPGLLSLINRVDAECFVTVDEPQRVVRGYRLVK